MIKKLVNFLGDPQYRARRRRLFFALLLITLAADFLVTRDHVEVFWQGLPGWGALFGLIASLLLVVVPKFLSQ